MSDNAVRRRLHRGGGVLGHWLAGVLVVGVLSGCSAPSSSSVVIRPPASAPPPVSANVRSMPPRTMPEATGGDPHEDLAATRAALAAGDEPTWARVVEDSLAHPDDPRVRERTWWRVEGREEAYFGRLFAQAAKESRPIESELREGACRVVVTGRTEAAQRLVESVAHQACCLRRSHLAAVLEGITAGLELLGDTRLSGADTARQVSALAQHADSEVATAARGLLPWIAVTKR